MPLLLTPPFSNASSAAHDNIGGGGVVQAVINHTAFNAAIILAELASLPPLYAVSAYVVRVMCTTSILHLNLRLLFVWHALAAMMFGAGRAHVDSVNLLHYFFLDNNNSLNKNFVPKSSPLQFPQVGSRLDNFLYVFGIMANLYVTPTLVIERIIATRAVNSYEQRQTGHYAFYSLMLLTLLASATMAFRAVNGRMAQGGHGRSGTSSPMTIAVGLLNIVAGVAAYLILLVVLSHNERSYREEQHKRDGRHNLSSRYQRSENIRATRQLIPVTLLHLLQNIPSFVFLFVSWVGVVRTQRDFVIYTNICSMCLSWFYLALQVTIITSHPTLRREARTRLRRWLCFDGFGCAIVRATKVVLGLGGLMGNRVAPGGGAAVNYPGNNENTAAAAKAIGGGGNDDDDDDDDGQCKLCGKRKKPRKITNHTRNHHHQHHHHYYHLKSTVDGRELLPQAGVNLQDEHFKNLTLFWAAVSASCAAEHNPNLLHHRGSKVSGAGNDGGEGRRKMVRFQPPTASQILQVQQQQQQ